MTLMKELRKYAHNVVEWLDSIPSIPATCGGVVLGMIVPKTVLFILVAVLLLWAYEEFEKFIEEDTKEG